MRPKKVVLLIDAGEASRRERRFLLETHRFKVRAVESTEAAVAVASDPACSLDVMVSVEMPPFLDAEGVVDEIRKSRPFLPALVLKAGTARFLKTDKALLFEMTSSAAAVDLLEVVKFLAARKRGPSKESRDTVRFESEAA